MGESYAVNLRKVAIGDGFLGSLATIRELPVINILETYPAIIGYNEDVFNYFREQTEWKRGLTNRANGTLDPWYGCNLFDEMWDYAFNFTYPWKNGCVDFYDIPDATNPTPPKDASPFLNDPAVRAALHAPISKNWSVHITYPFGSTYDTSVGNEHGDPSVEPVAFLTPLFANTSARGILFVFYLGNDDSDIPHHGTEVVIQNLTLGGIQGFTKKPSTPWFNDQGEFAGIVHQERNLTYMLFEGARHTVLEWRPAQALVFLQEFVLGDNRNGTVLDNGTVVGGENATLAQEYLVGGNEIFYGSAKTEGTWTVPSATLSAWQNFIATATLEAPSVTGTTVPSKKPSSSSNGATANGLTRLVTLLAAVVGMVVSVST
ncbi:hypothetical protein V8D89_000010 [Ganoderma adspersum]